jgi:DNA-binding NarL/FixJ family response regulator
MRILMLDDHVMFLQGLRTFLSVLAPGMSVDIAETLPFALQLLGTADYDLILLDWHLSECSGEEAIRRMRDAGCLGRIVVLSGETSSTLIRSTIDHGAAGFIPKKFSSEQMISALEQVLAGQIYLPAEALAQSNEQVANRSGDPVDRRFAALTSRQVDTYRAAARGLPNKLIARELGIAESTVKSHLSVVYAVLGVRNRTEAAYQASREGTRVA